MAGFWRCALLGLGLGCGAAAPGDAMVARDDPGVVVFEGACDASGAVALSERVLVVGDDEDNVLRVYDAERGGRALSSVDLSPVLGRREVDLEAATRLGDRAFWMTSHGRSRKGKPRPERLRFFATTAPGDGAGLQLVGRPYDGLLQDLLEEPSLARLDLSAAAERPPKAPGGLNIEGLSATPDGTLLIGFRNPIPGGRALLVPLLNGPALVEGGGARADFGEPILLDLGQLGVRSLSWWHGRYLVAAGPFDAAASRLYAWDGKDELVPIAIPGGYNFEGFFSPESLDRVLLLSDDGSQLIEGSPCKELSDPTRKRFRAVWIAPSSH